MNLSREVIVTNISAHFLLKQSMDLYKNADIIEFKIT